MPQELFQGKGDSVDNTVIQFICKDRGRGSWAGVLECAHAAGWCDQGRTNRRVFAKYPDSGSDEGVEVEDASGSRPSPQLHPSVDVEQEVTHPLQE